MNANKPLFERFSWFGAVGGFVALLASPALAAVAGSAPAMSGVKEILVQPVRMGRTSISADSTYCALARGEIDTTFLKMMKAAGLPAVSAVEAKPQELGTARIEVTPEIVSVSSQGTECANWIAVTAQTRNTLRIPPIETPRSVVVTYWRGGLLINNSESSQSRAVTDTLEKLVRQLSEQYRLDQPPVLPSFEDDPNDKKNAR